MFVVWSGDGPVSFSIASRQTVRLMIGKIALCRFVGMIGDEPCEIEPQPERIVLPVGRTLTFGKPIGTIALFKIKDLDSRNKAIS